MGSGALKREQGVVSVLGIEEVAVTGRHEAGGKRGITEVEPRFS